jgi:3',5'-cyclic AMP phosphodiesterase CpdA
VLHCGDITDTGLAGEYERYRRAITAAVRDRIRHVPGNHDVRWDPSAKGRYRDHFGAVPYSFDAGGIHFTGFDPTQPLLEPGHCGAAGVVSASGQLVRVRLADGQVGGSLRYTLAHCFSAPAVAGGTLVVGDQDGIVHGIRLPAGPGSWR